MSESIYTVKYDTKFNEEHIINIVNDYKSGIQVARLKKKYNHRSETIIEIIKSAGLDYKPIGKNIIIADDITEKIINDYNSCIDMANLIKKYSLTKLRIVKLLEDNNITYDPNLKRTLAIKLKDNIIQDYQNGGITVKELTIKYNCPIKLITDILKDNGKNRNNKFNSIEWSKYDIITLLNETGSIEGVSKKTKIAWHYIDRYIKINNIKFDHKFVFYSGITDEMKTSVFTDYIVNGLDRKAMYKKYDLNKELLGKIIREFTTSNKYYWPIPAEKRTEFILYSKRVRRLSVALRKIYGLNNEKGKHWNHMLSVVDGFLQNVPIELVASVANQELIDETLNITMSYHSTISKDELLKKHMKYLSGGIL